MCNVAHPRFIRPTRFLTLADNPHDNVSSIDNIFFGAIIDAFPFSLSIVGIDSTVTVVLVGVIVVVGAVVVVGSSIVVGACLVADGCSCLVLFFVRRLLCPFPWSVLFF